MNIEDVGEFDPTSYSNGLHDASMHMAEWLDRSAEWIYHIIEEKAECICSIGSELEDDTYCDKWEDVDVRVKAFVDFWGLTQEEYEKRQETIRLHKEKLRAENERARLQSKRDSIIEHCTRIGIDPELLP